MPPLSFPCPDPSSRVYTGPTPLAPDAVGLFATTAASAGEQLLSIQRPLLTIPSTDFLDDRCQSTHWKTQHKQACPVFARLHPRKLPTPVRAVIHLLILQFHGLTSSERWTELLRRSSHIEHFRKSGGERWEAICLMSKAAKEYSGTEQGEELLRELYCYVSINSLTLTSPTFDPLGMCFDPFVACANHSCAPNAVIVFDGPRLCLRSLRAISKDEEVTISYVDCTNSFRVRQRELRDRYFFRCECAKCALGPTLREDEVAPDTTVSDVATLEDESVGLLEMAKSIPGCQDAIEALNDAVVILRAWPWPWYRQPLASHVQCLSALCLEAKQWENALAWLILVRSEIDPLLFPEPFHPVRVVHQWTLLKLLIHVSSLIHSSPSSSSSSSSPHPSPPTQHLSPSFRALHVDFPLLIPALFGTLASQVPRSHGPDSRFGKMVREKNEEIQRDLRGRGPVGEVWKDAELVEREWGRLKGWADRKILQMG
ncbi:MAG: hypothetical protein M1817_002422 [Caeruleum heppii]|nr:MAG: hypothetical protein M1817_002422 [Caeruleum heppii]